MDDARFLNVSKKHSNLVKPEGKIGKIPGLITKFHNFLPVFHDFSMNIFIFQDFYFPGILGLCGSPVVC